MESKGVGPTTVSTNYSEKIRDAIKSKTSIDDDELIKRLPGRSGYDVSLSDQGKEIAASQKRALDIARATSPVRQDRVDALKAQIEAGEYKVRSENIADGMLREAIRDHIAKNPEL